MQCWDAIPSCCQTVSADSPHYMEGSGFEGSKYWKEIECTLPAAFQAQELLLYSQ